MSSATHGGAASEVLPLAMMLAGREMPSPVANAAFHPGRDAQLAPPFVGRLKIRQGSLRATPAIEHPVQNGRDARLFPAVEIDLFTLDDLLVPVQRGEMLSESASCATPSYWLVIPQIGRVWREQADGDWSRAALPLILANDTDNHSHHGLATFLYRRDQITAVVLQFVQQCAPYLLGRHFVAWGVVQVERVTMDLAMLESEKTSARRELASRMVSKPWSELIATVPPGTLDGFGGPLREEWRVTTALVRDDTLYYQESATAYGPYPYPLEMRFGVRSVMKSVGAPLALLHLAEVYGRWVLTLKIGDYVSGLHRKWDQIRFIDVANMTSGFGGVGSFRTDPNDVLDGYLEGDYGGWYTAPSHTEKLAIINEHLSPYPWEPSTVMRYRDQDFYLLGAALDGFVKSVRGPAADLWTLLQREVFEPIGIHHAPAIRTVESEGAQRIVWLNAGFYPTLDDLAKISLLYQNLGTHNGQQLLHRQLTSDLLAARDAIRQDADNSLRAIAGGDARRATLFYKMGFHFVPYEASVGGKLYRLPSMLGFGETEVILYPNKLISLVIGKAAQFSPGEQIKSAKGPQTIRAVERLACF